MKPGDTIDVWVVEAALGAGGMGSVYRCHNRSATRILAAVKILDSGLRSNEDASRRFVREADILGQLDHPGIVKIRNVRHEHDPPYLEMEFVAGRSLESMLDRGALTYENALTVLVQVADALAYLHSRGIRHRDLKPANLLVQADGRVKLVDFGLAVEVDRSRITQEGMAFGTVSYAPPEWVTPEKLDPVAWDLYALGVVAWEAFTGRIAFPVSGHGSARQQALQVMMTKQTHEPLDLGPDFPEPLRDLIRALTLADPAERLTDARVVLERAKAMPAHMRRGGANVTLAPSEFDGTLITPPGTDRAPTLGSEPDSVDLPPPPERATPTPPRPALETTPLGATSPPVRGLALAAFGGLGAALVLGLGAVLVVGAGVTGWMMRPVPPRTVRITVRGDGGLPVDVAADRGRPAGAIDGARVLEEVAPGPLTVRWAVGEGCTVAGCEAGDCPSWCVSDRWTEDVAAGSGPLDLVAEVRAPDPRPVRVTLAGAPADQPVRAALGGIDGRRDGDALVFEAVRPGRLDLSLVIGSCPDAAAGCWPSGTCPVGCLAGAAPIEVGVAGDPVPASIPVSFVAPPAPAPTPTPDPPSAPSPPTAPHPRKGGWATVSMVEAFLVANPTWAPGSLRAQGAGAAYLKGWSSDGHPPPGTAPDHRATGVSGELARRVCKASGSDLADVSDLADATDLELRRDGDGFKLVELRDAEAALIHVDGAVAVSSAPFRCRR